MTDLPGGGWPHYLSLNKSRAAYHAYLKSPEWRKKRRRLLRTAGAFCALCGATRRLTVHHITYAHIGKEWPEDMRVVCWPCHQRQHREGFTEIPRPEILAAIREGRHVCQADTRRGRGPRCPILADSRDPVSNRWLCHVHHPSFTYQRQVAEKRREKQGRRKCRHCGNLWPREKHERLCVRSGVA